MSVFYFNRMPVVGPWGGGNKTLSSLAGRLASMGHIVTGGERDDVDVVFCVDPRPSQTGVTYDMLRDFANRKGAKLVQRVGDVGTHGKPDLTSLIKGTAPRSDRVIFTSEWARQYVQFEGACKIIPNGALPLFYDRRRKDRPPDRKLRIVTHHWSNNLLKGISDYERLVGTNEVRTGEFEFTYIGRSSQLLANYTIAPMGDRDLAREIPTHDVYLSCSVFEAGANHIVEAMACGLPVVYSAMGGSIPEYCEGRGQAFIKFDEMMEALRAVRDDYSRFWQQSQSYSRSMKDVVDEYVEVLCGS